MKSLLVWCRSTGRTRSEYTVRKQVYTSCKIRGTWQSHFFSMLGMSCSRSSLKTNTSWDQHAIRSNGTYSMHTVVQFRMSSYYSQVSMAKSCFEVRLKKRMGKIASNFTFTVYSPGKQTLQLLLIWVFCCPLCCLLWSRVPCQPLTILSWYQWPSQQKIHHQWKPDLSCLLQPQTIMDSSQVLIPGYQNPGFASSMYLCQYSDDPVSLQPLMRLKVFCSFIKPARFSSYLNSASIGLHHHISKHKTFPLCASWSGFTNSWEFWNNLTKTER